jgi:hypothetical protein
MYILCSAQEFRVSVMQFSNGMVEATESLSSLLVLHVSLSPPLYGVPGKAHTTLSRIAGSQLTRRVAW